MFRLYPNLSSVVCAGLIRSAAGEMCLCGVGSIPCSGVVPVVGNLCEFCSFSSLHVLGSAIVKYLYLFSGVQLEFFLFPF